MSNINYKNDELAIDFFLADLEKQDIRFSLENNRLKINAPKGIVTPSLQEAIKRRKTDIIAFYKNQTNFSIKIPRLSRQASIPCSFAQQRLWLMDKLEPNSHAYNIPCLLYTSPSPRD